MAYRSKTMPYPSKMMQYRWETPFDCPRTVAHRQRNGRDRLRAVANRLETEAKRSRSEAYRSRRAADRPRKRPLRVWAGSHRLEIPERWLETTSSRSRAAANGCGRRRTRHGSTRPDRWGSVRLACGCRPAADGVVPARGGALRPPDARRRLEDVAVRESSASARLWRRSHRLETQPSEEPVSPIGDRRSDHSGGRRRTTHRGAPVRLHKSMTTSRIGCEQQVRRLPSAGFSSGSGRCWRRPSADA